MAEKTTEVMQVLVERGRDGEEAEPFAFETAVVRVNGRSEPANQRR